MKPNNNFDQNIILLDNNFVKKEKKIYQRNLLISLADEYKKIY